MYRLPCVDAGQLGSTDRPKVFQSRGSDAEFQLELRIQPSGCNFVRLWPTGVDYLPHLRFWLDCSTPFRHRPGTGAHSLASSCLRMLTSSDAETVKLNSVVYLQQHPFLRQLVEEKRITELGSNSRDSICTYATFSSTVYDKQSWLTGCGVSWMLSAVTPPPDVYHQPSLFNMCTILKLGFYDRRFSAVSKLLHSSEWRPLMLPRNLLEPLFQSWGYSSLCFMLFMLWHPGRSTPCQGVMCGAVAGSCRTKKQRNEPRESALLLNQSIHTKTSEHGTQTRKLRKLEN